jgi:hypothetical protein
VPCRRARQPVRPGGAMGMRLHGAYNKNKMHRRLATEVSGRESLSVTSGRSTDDPVTRWGERSRARELTLDSIQ